MLHTSCIIVSGLTGGHGALSSQCYECQQTTDTKVKKHDFSCVNYQYQFRFHVVHIEQEIMIPVNFHIYINFNAFKDRIKIDSHHFLSFMPPAGLIYFHIITKHGVKLMERFHSSCCNKTLFNVKFSQHFIIDSTCGRTLKSTKSRCRFVTINQHWCCSQCIALF